MSWMARCSTASGAALHRSLLPLNLHSARVRRNRGRLPSSRCIESARTHRARARPLPPRASDTTLGLLARSRPRVHSFDRPVNLHQVGLAKASAVQ